MLLKTKTCTTVILGGRNAAADSMTELFNAVDHQHKMGRVFFHDQIHQGILRPLIQHLNEKRGNRKQPSVYIVPVLLPPWEVTKTLWRRSP